MRIGRCRVDKTMPESLTIQATTLEELQAAAIECWQTNQKSVVNVGVALISVRTAMKKLGHGAFTKWYRDHNMDENHVHYCIRKAQGKTQKIYDPHPLYDQFGGKPFSVFDSQEEKWIEREKTWHSLGVEGGHNEQLNNSQPTFGSFKSVSGFSPTLAEIGYRWFAPTSAGEGTKGLVAGCLGHRYTGCERRLEQIARNYMDADEVAKRFLMAHGREMLRPNWIHCNSANLNEDLPPSQMFDLVWTSPPYYDLERYSDSEEDGSAFKTYEQFLSWYEDIFRQAVSRLKMNRFLVIKVTEIRDEIGWCRDFVGYNTSLFKRLGLNLCNHAIFVTCDGSAGRRVANQFLNYRKLVRTHQHVLFFYNGDDPKRIPEELGPVTKLNVAPEEENCESIEKPQEVAAACHT